MVLEDNGNPPVLSKCACTQLSAVIAVLLKSDTLIFTVIIPTPFPPSDSSKHNLCFPARSERHSLTCCQIFLYQSIQAWIWANTHLRAYRCLRYSLVTLTQTDASISAQKRKDTQTGRFVFSLADSPWCGTLWVSRTTLTLSCRSCRDVTEQEKKKNGIYDPYAVCRMSELQRTGGRVHRLSRDLMCASVCAVSGLWLMTGQSVSFLKERQETFNRKYCSNKTQSVRFLKLVWKF